MITGTEFKLLREKCGLTLDDVAEFLGCNVRSVTRWESGKSRISENAQTALERVHALVNAYAAQALKTVEETIEKNGMPAQIALVVYDDDDADMVAWDKKLPFHTHAACVFRTYELLRGLNIPARIVKMDRYPYYAWQRGTGKKDTSATRSEWAALQLAKDKAR